MECAQMWLMISICWILLLMILIIYWLLSDQWLASLVAIVLLVVEVDSVMRDPTLRTPAASFVIAAEWFNLELCFLIQCMDEISRTNLAIINAFTTGMSASLSYYLWKVKYLMIKCWQLRKGYATVRTPLSTKTLSERYSDL